MHLIRGSNRFLLYSYGGDVIIALIDLSSILVNVSISGSTSRESSLSSEWIIICTRHSVITEGQVTLWIITCTLPNHHIHSMEVLPAGLPPKPPLNQGYFDFSRGGTMLRMKIFTNFYLKSTFLKNKFLQFFW